MEVLPCESISRSLTVWPVSSHNSNRLSIAAGSSWELGSDFPRCIEGDSIIKQLALCYRDCDGGFDMPKFLIEREIPGAGDLSQQQLQAVSEKSCSVLRNLGSEIQWVHSYVTGDKIYCVYIAPNEQIVREHARLGGFPANRVSEIKSVIDPTTAEKV
jgi:hypothetical protein